MAYGLDLPRELRYTSCHGTLLAFGLTAVCPEDCGEGKLIITRLESQHDRCSSGFDYADVALRDQLSQAGMTVNERSFGSGRI